MLRRPGPPLWLAIGCGIALAITGVLAKLIPVAQRSDVRTLGGFLDLNRPRLSPVLDHIAHLADPAPYALTGLLLVLVALVRGRARVAAAVLVLFAITGFTTEQLKLLLASPRPGEWLDGAHITAASWPSGHSTAAMTMALCAVLVAPPRLRPTVAVLGGGFAIAVAYAILALGWHFPSDVLGGYLVAATYVLLAASALAFAERLRPARRSLESRTRPSDLVPAVGVALTAGAVAIGLALARPHALVGYAQGHTTFVAGAVLIAALAVLLAVGMAAGLRGARPTPR